MKREELRNIYVVLAENILLIIKIHSLSQQIQM
jgi:hypothetical protein